MTIISAILLLFVIPAIFIFGVVVPIQQDTFYRDSCVKSCISQNMEFAESSYYYGNSYCGCYKNGTYIEISHGDSWK